MLAFAIYSLIPILILSLVLYLLVVKCKTKGYIFQASVVLLVGMISSMTVLGVIGLLVGLPAVVLTALVSPVLLKKD